MSVGTILIRTAELAERLYGELVGDGDVPLRGLNTVDAARAGAGVLGPLAMP